MIVCADDTISRIEEVLAEKLGPQRFNIWFRNSTRMALTDGFLRISAPNQFVGDWIERHFGEAILDAAREATGAECTLSFEIDASIAKDLRKKQPDRQLDFAVNNPERLAREQRRAGQSPLPSQLRGRLDEFVVGPSNQLAFAAASDVVATPGQRFSPLFIHGGCGIGKTHLLQGICNGIAQQHPNLRWRYVSGEEFTNDYVCAVKSRETEAFRARYRQVDVLVIDDVHFFANKRSTQEEFLETFKVIDVAGKQIVLASDAHPKTIGYLNDALVSRFLQGMVVRIDAPDVEVRTNVLRKKAEKLKVSINDRVIVHIAENFRSNIRELEGALLKIVALSRLSGEPITLALAERAIRDLVRQTAPVVLLSDIESVSAIYFGLTPADLHTSRKSRTIALARGVAMYLARRHTDLSFPEIGRFMGNKNHSTVILAARRISKLLQQNAIVRWQTPGGQKEQNLAVVVSDLEEQFARSVTPAEPVRATGT